MKKLKVTKGAKCMACLECVRACSTSFYKEFDPDKSCIQIIEKNDVAKPMVCVQCGKCAKMSYVKCLGTQKAANHQNQVTHEGFQEEVKLNLNLEK